MPQHKRAPSIGVSFLVRAESVISLAWAVRRSWIDKLANSWNGKYTLCKAGAVSEDMAAVTCTYPLNLNQTKRSFCVIHYEGSEKRTDVVTACSWEGAELLCVFEEGFHFRHHTVSDEFTVELPIQKGTGEFSCDTIPPDIGVTVEKCTLSSTDSGVDENVSTNTTVNPIPRAARPAQDSDKCGCVTSKGLLAASVVLSTTIVVLSILLVALYVHYKRFR
ncbi:hypothetical protein V1264_024216 [Littorina saxatilis]|uniref:Uncharacterized protein n=1 Tax=Littorina saxatilis TaxID=31220 RepID=A0AAN9ALB2_9CAEN